MATIVRQRSHANPVYEGYFADPFIWEHRGTYYAIGTGESEASGKVGEAVFPLLQSRDFFTWKPAGIALNRPDVSLGANFWAPEVAFAEDHFFLYYSVGHGDKNHQLRVAVSDSPLGPYRDLGRPLLDPDRCSFAIDPHPFQDDDGRWYLFYARDFLDCSPEARAGTALTVAALRSMTELEDQGRPILRARWDWQRFEADRLMYERRWDWHTLEGPCVRKHEGRYYCFYSGGRWENDTYGVDYAVAEKVIGPYADTGSNSGPRVLRTIPQQVVGPGHNSIVTGPDGESDYIIYHAWDPKMVARRMCIDRLLWTESGPRCHGSSWRK